MVRSPRSGRSTAPSPRCSAPSCCAPAPTGSRAARGQPLYQIKRCPVPARARSNSPNMASWCARPMLSCRARAPGEDELRRDGKGVRRARFRACRGSAATGSPPCRPCNPGGHQPRGGRPTFAVHQAGGFSASRCSSSHRPELGQRAYFPADRSLSAGEVLDAFLAQFTTTALSALSLRLARARGARLAGGALGTRAVSRSR